MDFSNERYVRAYTRDTAEWLALSWQARGLFLLLLRRCDRAGVIELGKVGKRGIAALLTAPWSELDGPLAELLTDGCIEHHEAIGRGVLVVPRFIEAQEAIASGATRSRAWRERRCSEARGDVSSRERDAALRDRDETSRERDAAQRGATRGDAAQRRTVLYRSVPIRSVPGGSAEGGSAPAPAVEAPAPPPSPPAPARARQGQSPTGTRIPANWSPPPEVTARMAQKLGLSHAEVRDQADRFRDYWRARAGAGARKADWTATWRNWLREAAARRQARPPQPGELDMAALECRPATVLETGPVRRPPPAQAPLPLAAGWRP